MTLTCCQDHILTEIYGLYGLKHHIVEMRGGVTDAGRTNEQTLKIELLSQWKLEAEFRNYNAGQNSFLEIHLIKIKIKRPSDALTIQMHAALILHFIRWHGLSWGNELPMTNNKPCGDGDEDSTVVLKVGMG